MIDILTGEETRICLLLRKNSQAQNWYATYKDPLNDEYRVITRLLKEKSTKIKINTESYPLKIDVEVPVTLQLIAIPSQVDYVKNVKNQKILQKSIEEELNKKTIEFVKKTQEEYHDEPFMWYMEARRNFWRTDEFYNYIYELVAYCYVYIFNFIYLYLHKDDLETGRKVCKCNDWYTCSFLYSNSNLGDFF